MRFLVLLFVSAVVHAQPPTIIQESGVWYSQSDGTPVVGDVTGDGVAETVVARTVYRLEGNMQIPDYERSGAYMLLSENVRDATGEIIAGEGTWHGPSPAGLIQDGFHVDWPRPNLLYADVTLPDGSVETALVKAGDLTETQWLDAMCPGGWSETACVGGEGFEIPIPQPLPQGFASAAVSWTHTGDETDVTIRVSHEEGFPEWQWETRLLMYGQCGSNFDPGVYWRWCGAEGTAWIAPRGPDGEPIDGWFDVQWGQAGVFSTKWAVRFYRSTQEGT